MAAFNSHSAPFKFTIYFIQRRKNIPANFITRTRLPSTFFGVVFCFSKQFNEKSVHLRNAFWLQLENIKLGLCMWVCAHSVHVSVYWIYEMEETMTPLASHAVDTCMSQKIIQMLNERTWKTSCIRIYFKHIWFNSVEKYNPFTY